METTPSPSTETAPANHTLPIWLKRPFQTTALVAFGVWAQSTATGQQAPADSYTVVDRGPNYRTWQRTIQVGDPTKTTVETKTSQYVELADGLHYWDGQWKESQNLIELIGDHAVAQKGPHKVIFNANINTDGAIDVQAPDGKRFRSHLLGLFYFDAESGQSVQIARVKDSIGKLVPPNQVVYEDAFEGLAVAIRADVQYIYTKGGFEQNVILLDAPPSPDQFGLGPRTRLEVMTEFLQPPGPAKKINVLKAETDLLKRAKMVEPDLIDETLDFGSALFPVGKAFAAEGQAQPALNQPALIRVPQFSAGDVPTGKRWLTIDNRTVLVESVDWSDLEPKLKNLRQAALLPEHKGPKPHAGRVIAGRTPSRTIAPRVQLAQAAYVTKGVVIDYETIYGSVTYYTFNSGTTYYISGSFTVTANATFQGGTVIKYDSNAYLWLNSASFSFPAAGQLMPVLTSKDDNLFGETITGSTGNPTYHANPSLAVYYVASGQTIQNARFRWAIKGIEYVGSAALTHTVRDCLFQQCQTGVLINMPSGSVTLQNVTKCGVTTPVTVQAGSVNGSMTEDCGPLHTVANFAGISRSETQTTNPPDTMGAIGQSHFVEIVNSRISVFSKYSGARLQTADFFEFFNLTYGGTTYPVCGFDPRIAYDFQSQRWFACIADACTYQVILAVSKTSDPVGNAGPNWVPDNWTKYLVPFASTGSTSIDYPTLGFDSNGIYIPATISTGPAVAAILKAPLLGPNAPIEQGTILTDVPRRSFQPTVSFDSVAPDGIAWFVGEGDYNSDIAYGRLRWINGVPGFMDHLTNIFGNLAWPTVSGVNAPHSDPPTASQSSQGCSGCACIALAGAGDFMMAMVRSGNLWTCRAIGVDSAGNSGGSITPDRSTCEWFKLQIVGSGDSSSLTQSDTGRVRDPLNQNTYVANSPSTPWSYYMPSLVVNSRGDMVIGFSGSRADQRIGAFYTGRLAGDSPGTTTSIKLLRAGQTCFDSNRWGDYSYTSLDPNDSLTLWTVQEYAAASGNIWGTWIGAITPY